MEKNLKSFNLLLGIEFLWSFLPILNALVFIDLVGNEITYLDIFKSVTSYSYKLQYFNLEIVFFFLVLLMELTLCVHLERQNGWNLICANLLNLNSKQRSVTNLYLLTVDFACEIDPVQKSAEIGKKKIQNKQQRRRLLAYCQHNITMTFEHSIVQLS